MAHTESVPYPLPTVHLNGSGRDRLYGGYQKARHQMRDALEAFYDVEFHLRDYYVQEEGAFVRAQEERNKHIKALQEAKKYLDEHVVHLM